MFADVAKWLYLVFEPQLPWVQLLVFIYLLMFLGLYGFYPCHIGVFWFTH